MSRRYLTILCRFWKNSLIRELSFRANFVINVSSELGWIVLVLIFLKIIFTNTANVSGWNEYQYLFLAGTHMIITSIFEALFFDNCWRFSELVRSGNLDFILLKPANTQFLVSVERINFSAFANLPVGIGVCIYAAHMQGDGVTLAQLGLFAWLIVAGIIILYALLFMFAMTSVWLIRQTGMEQLWFYTTSVARYPAEIYRKFLGGVVWYALVFVLPVLLVVNLSTGATFWAQWPAIAMVALVALQATPLFARGWFKLQYARGAVIVGALALINLVTWSGYPWALWPAGALVVIELARKLSVRSH